MGQNNKVEYNCNATTLLMVACMPKDFLFNDGDESNNPFVMVLGTNCDAPFLKSYPQTLKMTLPVLLTWKTQDH